MSGLLTSPDEVARCLVMYTDWWQPFTSSVLQVGGARRKGSDTIDFRGGLLETLDERTELARRVCLLREPDRHLLLMWYVQQLPTEDIADMLGISIRQCFRRRARAVRKIVELGEPDEAA